MYLSKIEIFGFKSFAHRVRISFDKGLTAIVGPNGCGKTNVVDAIRWVLGEQKSSLLRSAKMENIIFNGSKNLKPLSFTEVSLTIENTRNVLPTEYTEVTITRRIYRNGESGFLLNQVPCRLKDILDLFTDTGMGSDAYSVIELKMIEEIISNKSEERMKLFEEAAGITRYKQRRKQTFRQLESASRDLSRVDDLLSEVEKKVRSLKIQVRKAEKLKELKTELRGLDLGLSWRKMEELQEKVDPLEGRIRQEEMQNHELAARMACEDSAIQEAEVRQLQEEEKLSDSQKRLNACNEAVHELEKRILQQTEQEKKLTADIQRVTTLAAEKARQIEREDALSGELEARRPGTEEKCSELEERYNALAREHDQLNATLREQRNSLARERSASAEQQKEANRLAMQRQSLEARKEHLQSTLARLAARKRTAEEKLEAASPLGLKLQEELGTKKERLKQAKKDEAAQQEQREKIRTALESLKEGILSLRSAEGRLQNSILLANSVLDSFEGMPEGIGFLEKQKEGRTGMGCMTDLISLEEEHRRALNAALGEGMNYYVSRTLEDARNGAASLRHAGRGKVHFLVLDMFKASPPGPREIEGARPALDLLSAPGELQPALTAMLSGCYVVDTLDEAETLAFKHPDITLVTREGEKFSARGTLLGGSPKESEGLRLGKKTERDRLQKELALLQQSISKEDERKRELEGELQKLQSDALRRSISELESSAAAIERQIARHEAEGNSLKQELAGADAETRSTAEAEAEADRSLKELIPALEQGESGTLRIRKAIQAMQTELTRLEERHHEMGREVQARQSGWRDALLELEKLRISIEGCRKNRTAFKEETARLLEEERLAREALKGGAGIIRELQNELETLIMRAAAEQKSLNERESAYRQEQVRHQDARTEVREMSRKLEVGRQLQGALQEERAAVNRALDHLFTEVRLKHGCDLATMDRPPMEGTEDPEAAGRRLEELEKQREQFGAVNELALEEYDTEKERFLFLTEQKNDLSTAETQLRETIEEINRTALKKFDETFRAVRKNFTAIFQELFDPEDEADLLIHTGEDPLEAHIEIIAKPKGKKPLSIEQLSGGEKALTALSLLFSIYLVKPSPFCILDEVDAPLDDGNVGRFTKLLKKFENNTQFIIVTHNKNTMASCQALYGVTMEEEGVSKLIPVRLEKIRH
ncbi:chromosome segregation protein SMC [Pelodictyon luteolum]|uniref:Chromosome partition protein Smc n=1 Tax=Chlorobium luteolum (strain DSM 273 / BCRC 81028 / 2530) TaxID=319225 RepID=Q3B2A0_CHLL3|nr:chromosome segregation protein SMC [Pelodictyon luteolum]ABB24531.1 Chromosome segregation protein SMC [Pelodictyon luteolum DSM 273]